MTIDEPIFANARRELHEVPDASNNFATRQSGAFMPTGWEKMNQQRIAQTGERGIHCQAGVAPDENPCNVVPITQALDGSNDFTYALLSSMTDLDRGTSLLNAYRQMGTPMVVDSKGTHIIPLRFLEWRVKSRFGMEVMAG